MRRPLIAALPVSGVAVALSCAVLAAVTLLWPGLAAAATVRPETVGSVMLDGALCFGPLGVPLAGLGGVVVWLERSG